jgi:hypothetical protein
MKYIDKIILALIIFGFVSCSKTEIESVLTHDFLKKTEAPPVVGEKLEFAYAMATKASKLTSVTAIVTFPGSTGTGFETKSYRTNASGTEVGTVVADTSTVSATSTATFRVDTNASTLRYTYVVPPAAKGKNISVTFKVQSADGKSVSLTTPEYRVSNVDIAKNVVMTNNNACYFSLETMKSYTEAQVIAQNLAAKIDLVYIFSATSGGFIYGHALVSPGTESTYLNGKIIPATFAKNVSKLEKKAFINDMLLSGIVPATYVDDIDFQTLNLSQAASFVLDLKTTARNSVFVESADGKYRAYLYINNSTTSNLTFSLKRFTVL